METVPKRGSGICQSDSH